MSTRKHLEVEIAELLGEPTPTPAEQRKAVKKRLLVWVARGKTVYSFCRQPGTPASRTVYSWLEQDLIFADEFRRARAVGYDMLAQQCLDIADHGDEKNVRHRKLRIWTRLQLLARWDSTRYGERIAIGGDAENPIRIMNDQETVRQIMTLLATAKTRQLQDPNRVSRELLN